MKTNDIRREELESYIIKASEEVNVYDRLNMWKEADTENEYVEMLEDYINQQRLILEEIEKE